MKHLQATGFTTPARQKAERPRNRDSEEEEEEEEEEEMEEAAGPKPTKKNGQRTGRKAINVKTGASTEEICGQEEKREKKNQKPLPLYYY